MNHHGYQLKRIIRPGIDQNTSKEKGWNKIWRSIKCSTIVYLQLFPFFLWLALFVICQYLSGGITVCGNRIFDWFDTNAVLLHSNNPKDFIFWSWPCSPQIRDAVDQLNFFSPSTQATTSSLSSVIFLILSLVEMSLFKASWKELRFLFRSSFEGSSVKCCFQLLDDIFWNLRTMNWRLKWRSLIPVLPFHTELIASVAFVVAIFIFLLYIYL